ncbi:MAG TPA: O-antigen ligase family protein [Terriglobia bacterium]|nr:O-antigen ligase family protein [Terriglobia bacterium]
MAPFIVITVIAVGALIAITMTRGFEGALPFFAFLVILLPLQSRIYFVDLFVLTTTRAVVVTLVGLYIVHGPQRLKGDPGNILPLKYLLLLYIGWSIVSTLNSVVMVTSVKAVIDTVLEFCLVYYIFAKSISSVQTIHKILAASIASLVVCCCFGVIERLTHWKVIDIFPAVIGRLDIPSQGHLGPGNRIASTFPHPILFGNALALGIPWALYLLSSAKNAFLKVVLWVAVIMMSWNIYKTSSRGPWLALVMSLAVLFVFSKGSIRKYLVIITVISAATLILRPGVMDMLRNTYLETRNPDTPRGASYDYRYELMRGGVHALARDVGRALWGYGPESFYFLGLEEEASLTGKIEVLESCDNAWVEIMVETGYVGLLLVAALLMTAAFLSWKTFRTIPQPANFLSLLFLINICAYAFMMVSVENFGWGQQTFMLWMVLAMSVVYPRLTRGESVPKQQLVPSYAGIYR